MTQPARPNSTAPEATYPIEQVRYGCSIGAMHTVTAIPRAIPIVHCGPGCADKQYINLSFYNGFQGSGYGGGAAIPSTNATEREVVFGGVDRLRELILASDKILDADLFVVLTGCIPDLVGDDVASVISDLRTEIHTPVVFAETGGFRGNNYHGHELVTKAIIDQFVGLYEGPRNARLVNVWAHLPYQNSFWRGDLAEIKRLLEGIGLEVNILFGHDSAGVSEWKRIPEAGFNLVLSPWLGVRTAKHLEKKYGQPYLHVPTLPIGAKETARVLRRIAEFAGLPSADVESFINREESLYYKYIQDFSDFFSEYWWGLPAKFAVVGDSAYALAQARFLVNQLGLIPVAVFVTENPPEESRAGIAEQFKAIADDVSIDVTFEQDSYSIHQALRKASFGHKPPLIFGSTWERDLVKELKGVLIETAFPTSYEVVLSRSYLGYRGALTLIEKIYSTTVSGSA